MGGGTGLTGQGGPGCHHCRLPGGLPSSTAHRKVRYKGGDEICFCCNDTQRRLAQISPPDRPFISCLLFSNVEFDVTRFIRLLYHYDWLWVWGRMIESVELGSRSF